MVDTTYESSEYESNGLQVNQHGKDILHHAESFQAMVSTKIMAVFGVVTNIM